MSKKVIIVGPPAAGKTTLRKVFFEGENSLKLLENALEPTHGQESIIFKLNQDIGIFDLAGQENERWLESDEKDVFIGSKVILVVIDASTEMKELVQFFLKIQIIRNELTPKSKLFLLIHKIDLLGEKELKELKMFINNELYNVKNFEVHYTSIKREFFTNTFSIFVKILEDITKDEDDSRFEVELFDVIVKLLHEIEKADLILKEEVAQVLNEPEEIIEKVIDYLLVEELIRLRKVKNRDTLAISSKGKEFFKKILSSFSLESETDDLAPLSEEKLKHINLPPLIGFLLSDKDGKLLLKTEIENGILKRSLREDLKEKFKPVDLDLVPMFISALEKFSQEINIHDLSGFNLKGSNLKMYIYGYDLFTVTFFVNPNLNITPINHDIKHFFNNNFKKYHKPLTNGLRAGDLTELEPFKIEAKQWITKMNKKCEEMIINIDLFDIETAKQLYDKLNLIQEDIITDSTLAVERVKKLKVDITKAILTQDVSEIKSIAQKGQSIKNKYV